MPCRDLSPRGEMEWTQGDDRRHRRSADTRRQEAPRLCHGRARCRDPDIEGRGLDGSWTLVLRAAPRAVLYLARLDAVRGRYLCRATRRANSIHRDAAP